MESFTRVFGNPAIAASANFLALLGGLFLLWRMLKFAFCFVRDAYHSSVKKALQRFRLGLKFEAVTCARDEILYLSSLARYGVMLILSAIALMIGLLTPPEHQPRSSVLSHWINHDIINVFFKLASVFWLLVFFAVTLRLTVFVRDVSHRRISMLRAERRAAGR